MFSKVTGITNIYGSGDAASLTKEGVRKVRPKKNFHLSTTQRLIIITVHGVRKTLGYQ